MKLSEFDYKLPRELIAQYPIEARDRCRMMVLDRKSRRVRHKVFSDISKYFKKNDLLVLNNTRVIPARLFGSRKTGGRVELFLLDNKGVSCEALVRPSGRINIGERILLESGHEVEVLGSGKIGRMVQFNRSIDEIMTRCGHMPLPPYIDRADEERDKTDYQTVYGSREGATASPTAGLHFTRELLARLSVIGVRLAHVTLHTSYGTFAPIKTDDVESHKMHREYFELQEETVNLINETKNSGGRVFAVGTTTTRVLEYCADGIFSENRKPQTANRSGYTDIFIYPGYKFKVVDHMITNFHLPKSTLMLLVSAFAGKDFIMEAYREAIAENYRFFSYGDAMLIV
ncbi:MAG: tRNA preQ1(34) S-adenosylmethionine ribosyltransferase-isomerase QueA [Candidatus Omnitrophota bacterium]